MGNFVSRKVPKEPPAPAESELEGRPMPSKKSIEKADRPVGNLLYNKSMKKVKSTPNISHSKSSNNTSLSRQKSLKGRPERSPISTSHPLSPAAREIIQTCFDNPHNDIGNRICMRMFEKRGDYQMFVYSMGKEKWPEMTAGLRDYLNAVIDNVGNVDEIARLSREYGEQHVPYKSFGFKPDFWVTMTDAMTTECIYLDGATHQPTDTIAAWSQLISLMFSEVRDGYYGLLRRQRKNSRRYSTVTQRYKNSLDVSTDGSTTSSSPVDPAGDAGMTELGLTEARSESTDVLHRTMSTIDQEDDTQSQIVQGTCYSGYYRTSTQSVL